MNGRRNGRVGAGFFGKSVLRRKLTWRFRASVGTSALTQIEPDHGRAPGTFCHPPFARPEEWCVMKRLLAGLLTAALLTVAAVALAQPLPGTPLGVGCVPVFEIRELPFDTPPETQGPISLGCVVAGGFVVLLDFDGPNQRFDPRNWSDVIAFTNFGPPQPGQPTEVVWMISDSKDPTTGIENGVTAADLAAAGVTVADILGNPTTQFLLEGLNPLNPDQNRYVVTSTSGVVMEYHFYSDPPEGPTPTQKNTWGRIKTLYR